MVVACMASTECPSVNFMHARTRSPPGMRIIARHKSFECPTHKCRAKEQRASPNAPSHLYLSLLNFASSQMSA